MAVPGELALITSEHAQQPNFVASVTASIQGISDTGAVLATLPLLFDLDAAQGSQLDVDGQWIGQTRDLNEVLSDDIYRALLYGTIGENQWNGSIPAAYAYLQEVFGQFTTPNLSSWVTASGQAASWTTSEGAPSSWFTPALGAILIQDYGNGTMAIVLIGNALPMDLTNLLVQGRLSPRPAGIRCYYLMQPTVGQPVFGFDAETANVAGFDVGYRATTIGDSATV